VDRGAGIGFCSTGDLTCILVEGRVEARPRADWAFNAENLYIGESGRTELVREPFRVMQVGEVPAVPVVDAA